VHQYSWAVIVISYIVQMRESVSMVDIARYLGFAALENNFRCCRGRFHRQRMSDGRNG
jgi:hypothetical protein